MLMRTSFVIIATGLIGCASAGPSSALLNARAMHEKAQRTQAPDLAPAQLRDAEQILARAEAAHRSDAQGEREVHLSYLAVSKYESAMAEARRRDAKNREEVARRRYFTEQAQVRRRSAEQIAELQKNYHQVQSLLQSTQAELDAVTRRMESDRDLEIAQLDELKTTRQTLDEQIQVLNAKRMALEAALADRDAKLEVERQARAEAEGEADSAKAALEQLQAIATIRENEEGTVITLTGEVLFASGKSQLLPTARERLDTVAAALKAQDERVTMVIEGHTDSKGTLGRNEHLSFARAQAVRKYLIEQGVTGDRIKAVGRGEREPVASNRTAEGRANNRRVEIILNEET